MLGENGLGSKHCPHRAGTWNQVSKPEESNGLAHGLYCRLVASGETLVSTALVALPSLISIHPRRIYWLFCVTTTGLPLVNPHVLDVVQLSDFNVEL